jgi:hypothetical protein
MGYPDWQTEAALSDLISGALEASGIPVVSNPVLRYNILAPPPVGIPGTYGVTAFGGGQSNEADIVQFGNTVNRTPLATRVYYQDNGTAEVYANVAAFDSALKAAFDLGLIAIISYKPPFSGTRTSDNLPSLAQMQTDQNAMKASLNSIIAAGFPAANLRVVMHHEANFSGNGISVAQYHNLYATPASGGQSNYTALHAICPVYSIMLGNQPPTSPQITTYPPITPILASNACDGLMVDWYAKPYTKGQWLGGPVPGGQNTWDSMARAANVPLGVGEMGGFAAQTLATNVQYLCKSSVTIAGTVYPGDSTHSLAAVMAQRLTDGLTNLEVVAFWNYTADPTLPTGVDVAFAAMVDSLASTASTSIGGGATVTLTPLDPSPVAGYASATGMSYDVVINAIAVAAGSTNPFMAVTLNWFNSDDPAALPAGTQKWSIPIGATGTAGTFIRGAGPQSGKYLQIVAHNNDTVGVVFSLQLNSTGRQSARHDWRWEAPPSVTVPAAGVLLPGGDGWGLSLGGVSAATINAGASKSWLFSLYAGEVGVRLVVFGTAGTNTVTFALVPQPTGRWTTVPVYKVYLPTGTAPFQQEVNDTAILPRGPCLMTVVNGDTNNITVDIELVALEG